MTRSVIPNMDRDEKRPQRPYEMVWARRREGAKPTLTFEDLRGWRVRTAGKARATLRPTHSENIWNRAVAKLTYRGNGEKASSPRVFIEPPRPIIVPSGADAVDLWVYGNRWDWNNPPHTPPVFVILHISDAHRTHTVQVHWIGWEQWWLMHARLPPELQHPATLSRIEISGGWQAEWRTICFDSIRFYKESLRPLHFKPRPGRNLTLFEGQSPGANTGRAKLPFPTREETILPMHLDGRFRTHTAALGAATFELAYEGRDVALTYDFDAAKGLAGIAARVRGDAVGTLLDRAAVRMTEGRNTRRLNATALDKNRITAEYSDGTILILQLWQKSLVVDVINRSGRVAVLEFGRVSGARDPRTLRIPFLTYGSSDPGVLLSMAGRRPVFTSIWPDWYRSNGSEFYAKLGVLGSTARINGGVRYHPLTCGKRNPLFERLFITVSPLLEEVLPVVPNPSGRHAHRAVDRLWRESWGPKDFDQEMRRCRTLRAYGIKKLIQNNHELVWRDAGDSFTLRTRPAPKKGNERSLRDFVAHQRSLGWMCGLYTNYTDFAPVNEYWNPDHVQRTPEGQWRPAWPRCYALKPLSAVEFDAELAPKLKRLYGPNSAYTDVHTAVSPWHYTDSDSRVPGAGTFAQTFYAYGELLRKDSRVYGGPIFSEGTFHWMYAGLADGNYALAYNNRDLAKEPLLPVFDLHQIHTKECDIGMGWTAWFCKAMPGWDKPDNIDRSIDRFLLHTLAYGHIGWLVEEKHGMSRVCRPYYMLQQVQTRYGLKAPVRIAYWDGSRLCSVSRAVVLDLPAGRRQLHIEYPGGLKLWLNDHPGESWRVRVGRKLVALPPAGWAAGQGDALFSFSGRHHGRRVDYLRSPAYTYLDGRGHWFDAPEAGANGALAVSPLGRRSLCILRISGEGAFVVRRAYGTDGRPTRCDAFDDKGAKLASAPFSLGRHGTRIEPVPNALRYVLRFER